jgi:hypothetical protein
MANNFLLSKSQMDTRSSSTLRMPEEKRCTNVTEFKERIETFPDGTTVTALSNGGCDVTFRSGRHKTARFQATKDSYNVPARTSEHRRVKTARLAA